MPSVDVNSNNIITFSFSCAIDLYNRTMLFTDLSTYGGSNGSNKDNVLGISFQVKDKDGVVYKDFDFTSPDIVPSSGSTYTLDWSSFGLPFILGNTLIITGGIQDQDSTITYTNPVYKTICKPNGLTESGYVPGMFQVTANCPDNVLTVKELTVFILNGQKPISIAKTGTLYYPTGTISPVSFTGTPFSNNNVYTGQNKVDCSSVATYDLGDQIYLLVTYLTKQFFPVTCNNKMADLMCCITKVQETAIRHCNDAIGANAAQQLLEISTYLMSGIMAEINGQDASFQYNFIKKFLNCDCGTTSLGQNEMTPINPAVTSIVLVGACGTTIGDPVVDGNTKTFTISSKTYSIGKKDSGDLAFTVYTDTSDPCQVKYLIKFDYTVMAGYILSAIENDPTLVNILNSIVNGSGGNVDLSGLNGKCVIDLSAINLLLIQNVNSSTTIQALSTTTVDHAAPPNLFATNATGIQTWLNTLSLGSFTVSYNNGVLTVLSLNNTNPIVSLTFNSPDLTVMFQKTNATLVIVLQAIIDYLCGLTACQVALCQALELQYFDYNGDVTSVNYTTTNSQNDYNVGLQNVINNLVLRINTLTGLTCDKLKAIFIDRPLVTFGASDRFYGTLGTDCAAITAAQAAMAIINAIQDNSDVKSAFCSIDCSVPAICPDVSNFSMSNVGFDVGLYGLTWSATPNATQVTTVRFKLNSSSTWNVATNSLSVLPNGNLSGSSPYTISGLVQGSTYDIWWSNNCGGAGFVKQITIPTVPIFSGSFRVDTDIYNICGNSPVTLYSSSPFATGVTMYTNIGLTILASGHNYIADSTGEIYEIDNTTAVVGVDTSTNCNSGTPGKYLLNNNSATICAQAPQTLYTSGAFAVGKTLYYDSALTTPVTGFSFVLYGGDGHIYNLNSSTGQILTDTGLVCSAYSGDFHLDNSDMTICAQTPVTLYSGEPYGTGVQMFTDALLTTPAVGFTFIASIVDTNIYNMNPSTATVTTNTGFAC